MGHKAAETTHDINNACDPGTLKGHTVQWWFRKSGRGDKGLEDEEHSGWPLEVDNDQLRESSKLMLLQQYEKLPKKLNVDHSTIFRHLKQIGKVKKFSKWMPHELTENFKNCHFEVSSSLILHNNKPSLGSFLTCHEKWILYNNQRWPAQWLNWEEASSSVKSLSHLWLFETPWTVAHQASLSITNFRSLLKLMSIESVMPSNHLIHCRPLLLQASISPSIRVFSNESVLCIKWPKYWSFSFSISPSNEYSGLISFRIDRLDLLVVQKTLKSLLQHHSSKASILLCSAFFIVQLSHPYMTTGKS